VHGKPRVRTPLGDRHYVITGAVRLDAVRRVAVPHGVMAENLRKTQSAKHANQLFPSSYDL
jgi:hypothetical protein